MKIITLGLGVLATVAIAVLVKEKAACKKSFVKDLRDLGDFENDEEDDEEDDDREIFDALEKDFQRYDEEEAADGAA